MHINRRGHYTYLFIIIVLFVSKTQAATITSAQSGNWDTGSTWVGGVAPGASDDVIILSGHTVTMTANGQNMTNLTINAGGVLNDGGHRPVVSGNLIVNGSITSTPANGRWGLFGANATIDGTGSITTDRFQIDGNKTILGSANLIFSPNRLDINGGVATNNGTVTSTIDLRGSGTWINNGTFNFSGPSITIGTFTATAPGNTMNYNGTTQGQTVKATTYHHLVISKTGQTATLGGNTTVNGTLTMTSGNIATGSSTLTLGTSTASLGTLSRSSGTIIGNFTRWFGASTVNNVLFPVGTSSNYRPANISFTSAPTVGGTLTASFTASNPGPNGLPLDDAGTSIVNCGANGCWTLTAGNGLTGGTYSLDLTADGFTNVSDFITLRIIKRVDALSAWTLDGTHSPGTGSNSIPIAHRTGMSGFSDFGIGGASDNPLPIQLLSFTAMVVDQNQVQLDWVTLSELNNYGFLVEKSPDQPNAFQTIPNSFVPGHGTTNVPQYYSYRDATASSGRWYYRLQQIDIDGTINFTEAIEIDVLTGVQENENLDAFALHQNYPNPFNPSTTIEYSIPHQATVQIKVLDVLGREVATLLNEEKPAGTYTVRWDDSGVASGVYFYRLTAGGFVQTRKMVLMR